MPTSPDRLSPEHLARLLEAHRRADAAREASAREEERLALVNEVLALTYSLGPDDAISDGGRLVRAAPAPTLVEPLDEGALEG